MLQGEHTSEGHSGRVDDRQWARHVVLVSSIVGLALRLALIAMPPRPAMLWDHHFYVQWGAKMLEDGVWSVHTGPAPQIKMWSPTTGTIRTAIHKEPLVCNYPPIAMMLIYVQARALALLTDTYASNTVTARFVFSLLPALSDFLIAAGCMALVARLASLRHGAVAFAAVLLAPPLIMDSCVWGQTDSWVLAPLVWMVCMMLEKRWALAGLLWGLALGLKTQAILAAPIWLAALLVHRNLAVVGGGLVGPVILFLSGLPFTLNAGWAWFQSAYIDNLFHTYPFTTLKAFNIWYIDLLFSESDDATRLLLGIPKDAWGKGLLAVAVVLLLIWVVRCRKSVGVRLLTFASLFMLAAVILPTRVHERYIVLPLVFLIASAGIRPKLWYALGPLMVAASFQVSVLLWLPVGALRWQTVVQQIHEQYAQLQKTLPPEELAKLPPPDEKLAEVRPRYIRDRWDAGEPQAESGLVLVELASAVGCSVFLLSRNRRADVKQSANQSPTSDSG